MLGGAIQFVSSGYLWSSLLLVVGLLSLLYIGWNNRTELWIRNKEMIVIKVVDCKPQEVYRCNFDKFGSMKFDEADDVAYFHRTIV